MQDDIALIKADIAAILVTTAKLDACINDVTDRIKVDVEVTV